MSSEQFGFQKEIRISVRKLVEFILRSGDLDNRRGMVPENAMAEGGRIHRMLQRRMGSEYRAEVPLRFEERTSDYVLTVEGRADGIIPLPDQITIVGYGYLTGLLRYNNCKCIRCLTDSCSGTMSGSQLLTQTAIV